MGVRPSLNIASRINRSTCGGDKKAGIAPTIGMNNAEFRHVMSESVSIAMISVPELKGAGGCALVCKKGFGQLGFNRNSWHYHIPNCTLRPDQGGVGKHTPSTSRMFIW